jgi:hypothetical protein
MLFGASSLGLLALGLQQAIAEDGQIPLEEDWSAACPEYIQYSTHPQ